MFVSQRLTQSWFGVPGMFVDGDICCSVVQDTRLFGIGHKMNASVDKEALVFALSSKFSPVQRDPISFCIRRFYIPTINFHQIFRTPALTIWSLSRRRRTYARLLPVWTSSDWKSAREYTGSLTEANLLRQFPGSKTKDKK